MSKRRRNRISRLPFLKIPGESMKRIFAVRIEDWRILGISENEASDKPPKIEPPAMFAITKTNVADDAIEVEDDSTAHGSGKERDNRSV